MMVVATVILLFDNAIPTQRLDFKNIIFKKSPGLDGTV